MDSAEFFEFFSGRITVQTFCDKKIRKDLAKILHFDTYTPSDQDYLRYLNEEGAGIYFCVNETDGKGRRAENVVKVRAVYADMDGAPLEKALEFNPSIVVESSPKRFHCYWLVKDVPLEGFKMLQQNIIRMLNSDPAIHDLPRVLRVPSFYHLKDEPFLVNVHSCSGDIFTYRELVYWFPPLKVAQWSAKKYQPDQKQNSELRFNGAYGAQEGERNHHVFKRVCGMLHRGVPLSYIEDEARKEAQACIPPMDESEMQNIIKSAMRYKECPV